MGHAIEKCRGCRLQFDPEFLEAGLCRDCRAEQYRWDVKAERD